MMNDLVTVRLLCCVELYTARDFADAAMEPCGGRSAPYCTQRQAIGLPHERVSQHEHGAVRSEQASFGQKRSHVCIRRHKCCRQQSWMMMACTAAPVTAHEFIALEWARQRFQRVTILRTAEVCDHPSASQHGFNSTPTTRVMSVHVVLMSEQSLRCVFSQPTYVALPDHPPRGRYLVQVLVCEPTFYGSSNTLLAVSVAGSACGHPPHGGGFHGGGNGQITDHEKRKIESGQLLASRFARERGSLPASTP
jgi:hypothetical protein